jgi:glutathione S-transferase
MKLYYSKAACSLGPHIALQELGIPHDLVRLDIMKPGGIPDDFYKVNPMGAVPVLVLDNGEALTEAAVILQYLGDLKPESGLTPRPGTWERVRLQETLNFIATEIHKGFGPLFSDSTAEAKETAKKDLSFRFALLEKRLEGNPWIMGGTYTVADAYLFTVLNWTNFTGMDLTPFPSIKAYMARVKERPAVIATMKAERLIH